MDCITFILSSKVCMIYLIVVFCHALVTETDCAHKASISSGCIILILLGLVMLKILWSRVNLSLRSDSMQSLFYNTLYRII